MRQPVKCPRTGMWLARYTAADGSVLHRLQRIAAALASARLRARVSSIDVFPDITVAHPQMDVGRTRSGGAFRP